MSLRDNSEQSWFLSIFTSFLKQITENLVNSLLTNESKMRKKEEKDRFIKKKLIIYSIIKIDYLYFI